MANVLTTCPFCGSGCNLYLKVENGRLTGVLPSASHPVSRGKLCIRGWHAHEFVADPDRLRWPLVKRDGSLQRASWEEALTLVAGRLPRGAQVGVVGSARCSNEDNYALMKFARCVLGTDNIDFSSRPQRATDLAALGSALGVTCATNPSPDLTAAEVITVVGADLVPEITMIASLIYEALDRGAKLVVISPLRTQLAGLAEVFLQPTPGGEPALLCGLLKSVVDQGLMDSTLLDRNWDAYDQFVTGLSKFSLDTVEERTGVAADAIARAAKLIGGTRKSAVLYSSGLEQHPGAAPMTAALANLVALTNHLGQPSMGIYPLARQNNFQGALDMGLAPGLLTGGQSLADAKQRFEQAWGCRLPDAPGKPLPGMLAGVKGLYVMGADVISGAVDPAAARRSLEAVDFLVVQELFMTPTAEMADVVLPAAAYAEKDGTATCTDRRVQLRRKAVDAPGEARPDWQIIRDLAGRMGAQWRFDSAAAIMAEIASLTPSYAGVTYEKLDAGWGAYWPSDNGVGERLQPKGLSLQPVECPGVPRADADHPFLLLLDPMSERWTTDATVLHSDMLRREYQISAADFPAGYVEINPEDAQEFQLRQGFRVKLSSADGEAQLQLKLSARVPSRTLAVPYHLREKVRGLFGGAAAEQVEGFQAYPPVAVSVAVA
jgi:predicted molibdopterin-dependent oxidoreductase YjgC